VGPGHRPLHSELGRGDLCGRCLEILSFLGHWSQGGGRRRRCLGGVPQPPSGPPPLIATGPLPLLPPPLFLGYFSDTHLQPSLLQKYRHPFTSNGLLINGGGLLSPSPLSQHAAHPPPPGPWRWPGGQGWASIPGATFRGLSQASHRVALRVWGQRYGGMEVRPLCWIDVVGILRCAVDVHRLLIWVCMGGGS